MDGAILNDSELYNVLACFRADREDEKYIVRGNITSFMGAGKEFVIDSTAQYRRDGKWENLLHALKVTSYYRGITVL